MENNDLDKILDSLDKFIFTFELWNLLDNNIYDFLEFKCKNNGFFTFGIGKWMNFLGTITTLKDYLSSCDKTVDNIKEHYFSFGKRYGWLSFAIDLRNCAVHDFAIPKDYGKDDGHYYLKFSDLIDGQRKLYDREKKQAIVSRIRRLEWFRNYISSDILDTQIVVKKVQTETDNLMMEVTNEIFNNSVRNKLFLLADMAYTDKFAHDEVAYFCEWANFSIRKNTVLKDEIFDIFVQKELLTLAE